MWTGRRLKNALHDNAFSGQICAVTVPATHDPSCQPVKTVIKNIDPLRLSERAVRQAVLTAVHVSRALTV